MVEDCRSILTERIFNARMERILCYGEIGERIVNDPFYEKYSKGNGKFLGDLAKDIGISASELARSIQFYKKFEIVSPDSENWIQFKEGKNISWAKIKKYYLPENPTQEEKHICTCPVCGNSHKV
jgi:hypothetical protein